MGVIRAGMLPWMRWVVVMSVLLDRKEHSNDGQVGPVAGRVKPVASGQGPGRGPRAPPPSAAQSERVHPENRLHRPPPADRPGSPPPAARQGPAESPGAKGAPRF